MPRNFEKQKTRSGKKKKNVLVVWRKNVRNNYEVENVFAIYVIRTFEWMCQIKAIFQSINNLWQNKQAGSRAGIFSSCSRLILDFYWENKSKNAEGHDRIPQRLLIDGAEILNKPMSTLINLVYNDKIIRIYQIFE